MAGVLAKLRRQGEITGVADECVIVHTLGKIVPERVAVVGFGSRARFGADRLRRSSAIACSQAAPRRRQARRARPRLDGALA